ncbi:MAG: hypothetical protein M3Y08_11985 [Fibrobacterota bacterium]|nr:hypothetical protein [Fibrobacterota bacterium]
MYKFKASGPPGEEGDPGTPIQLDAEFYRIVLDIGLGLRLDGKGGQQENENSCRRHALKLDGSGRCILPMKASSAGIQRRPEHILLEDSFYRRKKMEMGFDNPVTVG